MKTTLIIKALLCLLFISVPDYAISDNREKNDTTISLKEVTVQAEFVQSMGNRDEIILTKKQREFGTNALDAISSLPQFSTAISATSLQTADMRNVAIFINGIPSDAATLRTYQGNDIKKVTYYHEPPAKYQMMASGPVIDVTIRRRKDRLYSAYINALNAVTTGYGTDQASLTYADSLNMLTANYFIDYRNVDRSTNADYDYRSALSSYRSRDGRYSGHYQYGQLIYQRYQGVNLFNANVRYGNRPGHIRNKQSTLYTDNARDMSGLRDHDLRSDDDRWSADLYFRHDFAGKRSLAVNVVNTFSSSESHNRLWLKMPEQYSSMDYDILNNIDNRYYSIIAQADYTTPLWKGELNTGAYFNYKELRQSYNGGPESYLNMRQHYAYIAYTGRYKRLSYYASLGANAVAQHPISGQSFVNVIPYSSLTLFYRFTSTFSTRLIAKLRGTRPTTGDLAENRVNIDSRFIATGNPALKPYRTFSLTFKPQYSTSDGRLSLSPSIEYLYSHHPNVPCLLSEDDNIVMMPMRINARNELNGTMIVNYSPCNWMVLQSYYQYFHDGYSTPSSTIRHNYHRIGGMVAMSYRRLQFIASTNSPDKSFNGDMVTRSGWQYYASVSWKKGALSAGVEWRYASQNDYVRYRGTGFSATESTCWKGMKNLVAINLTYFFSKGKARKQAKKSLNNSDNDSGLIDSNTAKQD